MILSSNENPLGCHKDVLAAVKGAMTEAGRYPSAEEVTQLVAKKHNVKPENVLLGSGSTQIPPHLDPRLHHEDGRASSPPSRPTRSAPTTPG